MTKRVLGKWTTWAIPPVVGVVGLILLCRPSTLPFLAQSGLGSVELQAANSVFEGKDDSLAAIVAGGAAIRPLHTRMPPPRPGEWLATHHEPGQTFEDYRRSSPNRPDGRRRLLYLQPLGSMSLDQQRLIADTAEYLGRFYGLPVKTLDAIDLTTIPAKARRRHPDWGVPQIDSLYLLDLLKPHVPADAVAVLGLTASDLWPNETGRKWNFVFGQASLRDRVGVWSINRLGNFKSERKLLCLRTLKVAVHETGHMLGIQHCIAFMCGMNGSNHLEESDRQPLGFCPECEMKVWWACRLDPLRRYGQLAAFAGERGFETEATSWKAAAACLENAAP
jgi:archaemetzincin